MITEEQQKINRINWFANNQPDMVEWEAGTKVDIEDADDSDKNSKENLNEDK